MDHRRPRSRYGIGLALLAFSLTAHAAVWTSLGPDGGPMQSVTVDPLNAGVVYATSFSRAWKSTDGGASWVTIDDGFIGGFKSEVLVDPLDSQTIYVPFLDGIYKSTDGGGTWTSYSTGDPYFARSLAIDPLDPQNLWSGGYGNVARSTDGGVTWSITPIEPSTTFFDVAVDPVSPSTLYTAGSFGPGQGVWKSTDGGVTFTPTSFTSFTQAIAIDPVSPATLYAGGLVQKSTDAGATWSPSASGLPSGIARHGIAIDPSNPLVVYAGTGLGVYKSTNAGASWTIANSGLPTFNTYPQSIVIDPLAPATVYTALQDGVGRTTDGGTSWTVNKTGLRADYGAFVVVDPTDPMILYTASSYTGVSRTADGGTTWEQRAAPGPGVEFKVLLIDPSAPLTLYGLKVFGSGVARSDDGGTTWNDAQTGLPYSTTAIGLATSAPSTLYATAGGEVYKTTDGAASWSPTAAIGAPALVTLAVDSTDENVVLAGGDFTVYKTTDGGTTWTPHDVIPSFFGGDVVTLAIDPVDPQTVVAGVTGGFLPGFYRSGDGGASWGFVQFGTPHQFTFDTGMPARAFAATDGGLLASKDGGATWSNLTSDLPYALVSSAAVAAPYVYASVSGHAVWRRSVATCTTDADCDDANLCTTDTCAPAAPGSDVLGCVHATVTCPSPGDCLVATCSPTDGCVPSAVPDLTPCTDDGSICTTDLCRSGACAHEANVILTCDLPLIPEAGTLTLKSTDPARAALRWKWKKGEAIAPGDVGNPFTPGTSDYTLCGFDRSGTGGAYALRWSVASPAGGTCGTQSCWSLRGTKFRYKDPARTPEGSDTLLLVPGPAGGAKITAVAKGGNLTLPAGALVPEVRVQLRRDDDLGRCWETKFSAAIKQNEPGRFKAKSDL